MKADPSQIASEFEVSHITLNEGRLTDPSAKPLPFINDFELTPNFNVAPTHLVPAVVNLDNERTLTALSWGLVPSWAKEPSIGSKMINARVETIEEKPSFRSAIVKRRCIIPASGWYEWERHGTTKISHYITADSLLGFAGIYETWKSPDGTTLYSCSVITQPAIGELEYIHDRMPVFVARDLLSEWLASGAIDLAAVVAASTTDLRFTEWEVSSAVGNVRNNFPELLDPAATLF